jgi:hypothetical protein
MKTGAVSPSVHHHDKDDLKVDLDSNFSHSHGKLLNASLVIKKVYSDIIGIIKGFFHPSL